MTWKTAAEVNSSMFELERRITGNWERIGELRAGGISNSPRIGTSTRKRSIRPNEEDDNDEVGTAVFLLYL